MNSLKLFALISLIIFGDASAVFINVKLTENSFPKTIDIPQADISVGSFKAIIANAYEYKISPDNIFGLNVQGKQIYLSNDFNFLEADFIAKLSQITTILIIDPSLINSFSDAPDSATTIINNKLEQLYELWTPTLDEKIAFETLIGPSGKNIGAKKAIKMIEDKILAYGETLKPLDLSKDLNTVNEPEPLN